MIRSSFKVAAGASDAVGHFIWPPHVVDRGELAVFYYERFLHLLASKREGGYSIATIKAADGMLAAYTYCILVEKPTMLEILLAGEATSPPKGTNLAMQLLHRANLFELDLRQQATLKAVGPFLRKPSSFASLAHASTEFEIGSHQTRQEAELVQAAIVWLQDQSQTLALPLLGLVTQHLHPFLETAGFQHLDIQMSDTINIGLMMYLPQTDAVLQQVIHPIAAKVLPSQLQDPTSLTRF